MIRDENGLHGWLVVDKPVGLTSNRAVEVVRRHLRVRAGHAGTLDPLATGVLPMAVGEATKTAGYAMAGRKRYRFRIRWGVARATDDSEGEITAECPVRPGREEIEAHWAERVKWATYGQERERRYRQMYPIIEQS